MTANQQLKDYVIEQTKLGVSKDTVRSALLEAGWKEDDINQAVTEAESGPQEIATLKPASPIQPIQQIKPAQQVQQTQPFQPVKQVETTQASKPVNMSGLSSPAAKDSPVSFITSDIFQPKSQPVFQSSASGAKSQTIFNSPEVKPQAISMTQDNKSGAGMNGKILPISLGVVSIILLGGNVYFFLQSGDFRSKLDSLNNEKVSSESQVASLATEKKNLVDEVNSLNKTITELNGQISIFATPADGSSAAVSFDVTGALGGGGKSLYSLTTNKNIVLFVKNSKDADVESALKSLIGTQVSIGGTHQPESNQLTVTTVNGQPVLGASKAAAAAAAAAATTTSTLQTSTSTPGTGPAAGVGAATSTP